MVKIKKINKAYGHGGPLLNMVHLRHLMLKSNGEAPKEVTEEDIRDQFETVFS